MELEKQMNKSITSNYCIKLKKKYSKLIVKAPANASQAKLVDMVTGVRQPPPPPPHPTQYVVTVVIMWLRHVETIGISWQHVATV